ncbi:uncharacterized protein LOC116419550 [Sarcophilus harrisii]|uniref:uncharacterized protein LOC116419550 n=1 Tax=Sarcophilus harrisii TaxID=9305 RepID=UPI001301A6B5|nr:uncharacterized protein LOC116419550 [Sarcophilus harrisii]
MSAVTPSRAISSGALCFASLPSSRSLRSLFSCRGTEERGAEAGEGRCPGRHLAPAPDWERRRAPGARGAERGGGGRSYGRERTAPPAPGPSLAASVTEARRPAREEAAPRAGPLLGSRLPESSQGDGERGTGAHPESAAPAPETPSPAAAASALKLLAAAEPVGGGVLVPGHRAAAAPSWRGQGAGEQHLGG